MEVLREHATRGGYEVLEKVADAGQSGASLERPGMDHVRDLVATDSVSVVLAQDRDRFACEPAYLLYLREEFAEHQTDLRALNDRGNGCPEGKLTTGILDQIARYERLMIAERSRRGELRKTGEGKIVATKHPRATVPATTPPGTAAGWTSRRWPSSSASSAWWVSKGSSSVA